MKPKDVISKERRSCADGLERRDFLAMMGFGAATLLAGDVLAASAKSGKTKPNIVLILADDLGYADIGIHGCKDIPTPNIDSIGADGVRFTNAYVSCPVCSPTRAGLMTGRYQERFGHWYNPGPPAQASPGFGLPLDQITIADLLKKAGYKTALVGKWHLGLKPEFHPMKRGFDEFFGFLHGGHSYVNAKADPDNLILRGTEPVDEQEYLTDAFRREAVGFIERQNDGPFFLYFAPNAVHTPMEAPEKYLSRFPNISDQKRRKHAAMLSALDDAVGSILETVRKKDMERNTLVFFLSDNGGPTEGNGSSNAPLSGVKGTVLEGGIRVPLLMKWPDCLGKGKVCDDPVISLDVLATSVAAAGGEIPTDRTMDGVDLLPFVKGKAGKPHDALFWRYHKEAVIREGKWKLIKSDDGSARLYNLSKDVEEKKDLASEEVERVKELKDKLAKWEAELKPALWGDRAAGGGRQRRNGKRKNPSSSRG